jgi:Tfp pilus assembly protein PilO
MQKAMESASRSSPAFVKLFSDLWNGRGRFARLAEARRWRVLLVECAVLALVCGGWYLTRYEASARHYREALSLTANELNAVVLGLDAERQDLEAARHRRDVLGALVLDKDTRAQLLSAVTAAKANPGLEFVSMLPLPKQNFERYARCRVTLTVEGAFEDFLTLLRRLETDGSPCTLVKLDVESRWESGESERIAFVLETYAEADPVPEGKPKP